jgi:hypothetical protein
MRLGCRWVVEGLTRCLVLVVFLLALVSAQGVALAGAAESGLVDAELKSVSCSSASACMAVGLVEHRTNGSLSPVAERWDGAGWTQESVALPSGESGSFSGGSCPSDDRCVAVGDFLPPTASWAGAVRPLAATWDGSNWSVQSVPLPAPSVTAAALQAVSCSASNSCEAVGYYTPSGTTGYVALAERWDGSRWSVQPIRGTAANVYVDRGLQGVSCPTATSCFAVGVGLVEYWDGKQWSIRSRASRKVYADAVSCSAGHRCTAVGGDVARRTSMHWRVQAVLGEYESLDGVSCPSLRTCIAVGSDSPDHDDSILMGRKWNGTRWSYTHFGPDPYTGNEWLNSVSCTSVSACIAVGGGDTGALALKWNGMTWTYISP